VQDVEFSWRAHIRLVGPIGARVIEGLGDGEGYFDASLFGLVRLAHIRGGDLAFIGEATRYLAELAWNADAILFNHALEWRVLDQQRLLVAVGQGQRRGAKFACSLTAMAIQFSSKSMRGRARSGAHRN
jgi:hypothetical protein